MANVKPHLMCVHCELPNCAPDCDFRIYKGSKSNSEDNERLNDAAAERAVTKAAAQAMMYGTWVLSKDNSEAETKPKRVRRSKAEAEAIRESFQRYQEKAAKAGYWFSGRNNAIADHCACCQRWIAVSEGQLVKKTETSSVWRVVCRTCFDDSIPLDYWKTPNAEEKKPVTPVDVYRAGQAYFGTRADTTIMDDPHEPSREKFKEIERLTDMYRHLMMTGSVAAKYVYDPNGPADAPLSELIKVYQVPFSEVQTFDFGEINIRGKVFSPTENNDFCAFYDGTSNSSLCSKWGEYPESRERKHKSKRPKRV